MLKRYLVYKTENYKDKPFLIVDNRQDAVEIAKALHGEQGGDYVEELPYISTLNYPLTSFMSSTLGGDGNVRE